MLNALSMGANDRLSTSTLSARATPACSRPSTTWRPTGSCPSAACLIAIFAGWVLSSRDTWDELQQGHAGEDRGWYAGWRFLIRFVAPVAVGAIIFSIIFLGMEYQ